MKLAKRREGYRRKESWYPVSKVTLFSGHAGTSEILEDTQRRGYEFMLLAKPVHPLRLIEALKDFRESS